MLGAAGVLTLVIAVLAAEAQGLMWFRPAQQPIEAAAGWIQPWLPASRAVWGEGPFPSQPVGFRAMVVDSGGWSTMHCDALNYAQAYGVLHLAIFIGAVMLARSTGPDRAEPGLSRWMLAMGLSAGAAAVLPWLGQVLWTFTGAVERAAITAVSVVDPATGNTVAENPAVPASGPFARGGIVAGCVLLDIALTWCIVSRVKRAAARCDAHCHGCGYPRMSNGARCPECGSTPRTSEDRGSAWWARAALRGSFAAVIGLLLLTPFVLGWLGAALPDELWIRWVPF